MKSAFWPLLLALSVLLTACGSPGETIAPQTTIAATEQSLQQATESAGTAEEETTPPMQTLPPDAGVKAEENDYFSNRDLKGTYDESEAIPITLLGSRIDCASDRVSLLGSTVTITKKGTYLLSGILDDGMIIVDVDKEDKVQLVLDGVSIASATSAPIYVRNADKVFVTLAPDSENSLINGGSFVNVDDNNIDAVIFSKEDLTLNGSGSLSIQSPAGHGVVSKDELTVAGGIYTVTTAEHGFNGKDNVCIAGGSFVIAAGKDGIQADHDEDESLGFVRIEGGNFSVSAEGDGISASSTVDILDGNFVMVTGGGSVNGEQHTSQNWGNMGGGRGGPMGGPGGKGGYSGTASSSTTEESTSIKGIKAGADLRIWGGIFDLNCADDAIHSNTNVLISGGSFTVATGDDGFHAEENLAIRGGRILVTESYEGLEALGVDIYGGDITLTCTDDGINAAGGADQSGFGGMRGGDRFGGGSSNGYINIAGGTIYMNASGDGIDANGTLTISGGHTTVCGPTQGDTAVLDYDISATMTGGTFIGTGSSMMAQSFSSTEGVGVLPLSVGNQAANTRIVLKDSAGKVVIDYTPVLNFQILILACPDIIPGETYNLTIGAQSADVQAN